MTKIAGSGSASGSTPKCHGSGTPENRLRFLTCMHAFMGLQLGPQAEGLRTDPAGKGPHLQVQVAMLLQRRRILKALGAGLTGVHLHVARLEVGRPYVSLQIAGMGEHFRTEHAFKSGPRGGSISGGAFAHAVRARMAGQLGKCGKTFVTNCTTDGQI
jgi:hypothetical protein